MRLIATDVTRSVVCVFVCVRYTGKMCKKIGWTDRDAVWTLADRLVWAKETIRWGAARCPPSWRGTFERGHVPAHCNIPTHECIPRCSSAAAGDCLPCTHGGRMHSPPRGVSNGDEAFCHYYLGHLLLWATSRSHLTFVVKPLFHCAFVCLQQFVTKCAACIIRFALLFSGWKSSITFLQSLCDYAHLS